jgi:hypothetical protein
MGKCTTCERLRGGEGMSEITKYPVIGRNNKYLVKVYVEDYLFNTRWICNVYLKNDHRSLFNLRKFCKVNSYVTKEEDFAKYANNLILLAKEAVNDYEDWLQEEHERDMKFNRSKIEFKRWDGIVDD